MLRRGGRLDTLYIYLPTIGGEMSFSPSGDGPSSVDAIDFNGPALGVTFRF
jgi:hypothetical protein